MFLYKSKLAFGGLFFDVSKQKCIIWIIGYSCIKKKEKSNVQPNDTLLLWPM